MCVGETIVRLERIVFVENKKEKQKFYKCWQKKYRKIKEKKNLENLYDGYNFLCVYCQWGEKIFTENKRKGKYPAGVYQFNQKSNNIKTKNEEFYLPWANV